MRGVGHDDAITVAGVGCLLLAPPSLALATPYPFNRSFLFVEFHGMTAREPGGRWNDHPTMFLKLTADLRRIRVDQNTYVNVLVNPYLPAGTRPQRFVFSWGTNQHAEASLSEREWISLPARSADWTGNILWTLPISIDFPDGRTYLFEELSISISPRGRAVAPIVVGAAR